MSFDPVIRDLNNYLNAYDADVAEEMREDSILEDCRMMMRKDIIRFLAIYGMSKNEYCEDYKSMEEFIKHNKDSLIESYEEIDKWFYSLVKTGDFNK